MTDRKKKPGVAFWATVVVVVMLLYVLSIGPAAWLMDHSLIPDSPVGPVETAYIPLTWVAGLAKPTAIAYEWYVWLWIRDPRAPPRPE